MAVVNLIPDADGTVQQWTPNLLQPHWTLVDDPVGIPDEDATYVWTATPNFIEDFNHVTSGLLTGASITNVRLTFRAKMVVTGFNPLIAINPGVRVAGVRYPAVVNYLMTTSYAYYTWDWASNPAPPSFAWTKADIDNLQSSIMLSQVMNALARCTQLYFTVTYTPAPPTVTPVAGKGLVSWTP